MFQIPRIILGLLLLLLFTQIEIHLPINDIGIPITGQSFAVLLVPYILGRTEGVLTVFIYLLIGLVGLPVFADGGYGVEAFTSNSGGYLIGFLVAAYWSGIRTENYPNTLANAMITMLIGTLIILLLGTIRLAFIIGPNYAFQYGFLPFLIGGAIKIILGGFVGWKIKKHLKNLHINFDG